MTPSGTLVLRQLARIAQAFPDVRGRGCVATLQQQLFFVGESGGRADCRSQNESGAQVAPNGHQDLSAGHPRRV
jgi:hypothetical protein